MDSSPDSRTADRIRPPHVWPLERFNPDELDQIMDAVAQPKPPARYLNTVLIQLPSRAWYEWHWHRGIDPNKRRERISPALRQKVYDRDGNACLACGTTDDLSLDHIVHFSVGGKDTLSNLRTLCRRCNSSRGARSDDEWMGGA